MCFLYTHWREGGREGGRDGGKEGGRGRGESRGEDWSVMVTDLLHSQ